MMEERWMTGRLVSDRWTHSRWRNRYGVTLLLRAIPQPSFPAWKVLAGGEAGGPLIYQRQYYQKLPGTYRVTT